MQTTTQRAQQILTVEQLAAIQDAIDGVADVTIALTPEQVAAMVARMSRLE